MEGMAESQGMEVADGKRVEKVMIFESFLGSGSRVIIVGRAAA